MTEITREEIILKARQIRRFFEKEVWGGSPGGWCSIASGLATVIFNEDFGVEDWTAIGGYFLTHHDGKENPYNHCWSTDGRFIVDITCDQFNTYAGYAIPAVIVVPIWDARYATGRPYPTVRIDFYDRWKKYVGEPVS
jgi:hypothetical protein